MRCCSTRKSCTPNTASRSFEISPMANAAAPATGRSARSSRSRPSGFVSRSGAGKVVCGFSGGVDSTVAAMLIHRAIGDRLTCIFVDNGLLRHDEANQIQKRFRDKLHLPLDFVDATDLFLDRLAGVTDPEQKRKIIGGTFIDVFETRANELRRVRIPRAGHALS